MKENFKFKIIILGSSADKAILEKKGKDRRLRSLAILKFNNKNLLIDAGPDVKKQLKGFQSLEYLFLTHLHPDHTLGLCYILEKFPKIKLFIPEQIFKEIKNKRKFRCIKKIKIETIKEEEFFKIAPDVPISFSFLKVKHSRLVSTFAIAGKFKERILFFYAPDLKALSKESKKIFKNAEILILDGSIFSRPLNVHASIKEELSWCKNTKAKKIYFTHIGKNSAKFGHKILEGKIKAIDKRAGICWDGQEIKFF